MNLLVMTLLRNLLVRTPRPSRALAKARGEKHYRLTTTIFFFFFRPSHDHEVVTRTALVLTWRTLSTHHPHPSPVTALPTASFLLADLVCVCGLAVL